MDAQLRALLGREERRAYMLRGTELELRLLSAQALLEAQLEGEGESDPTRRTLRAAAALAARSLFRAGRRAFSSAQEVLETLSAEEICALMAAYRDWSMQIDPGPAIGEERMEALKKA